MAPFRAQLLAICMVVCLAAPLCARQTAEPEGSPQDLRAFLNSVRELVSRRREAELAAKMQNLPLPDLRAWFLRHFGEDRGATFTERYEKLLPKLADRFIEEFRAETKIPGIAFRVERIPGDENKEGPPEHTLLEGFREPVALWKLTSSVRGTEGSLDLGYFVFVDGHFRLIPTQVFISFSGAPPRIRVDEKEQRMQLVNQARPRYPIAARQERVSGTVVLRVIIATDGTIKELTVLSGHRLLAPAAVEAVRQWRYRPTLLAGRPVEVITTIEVTFSLGP